MGMVNRFIAVSEDEGQLRLFKSFLQQLLSSKYVGRDYCYRIRGEVRIEIEDVGNGYKSIIGELWSCGLSDIGHWISMYGMLGKFDSITVFIEMGNSDYIEMSNTMGDLYCNVWDISAKAMCGECLQYIGGYPMGVIADYFHVDYYE